MKNLKEYLVESSSVNNKKLFDICQYLENDEDTYDQSFMPLVKSCEKKKDKFDVETLENSASIYKLILRGAKLAGVGAPRGNDKTRLRKYVTALVMQTMADDGFNFTKEQEDYISDWNYNTGKNKLDW